MPKISRLKEGRRQVFRPVSREHILSLSDQAIVSGASFLATLSIAHWSDSNQLGIYAVGISLLISFQVSQDALILQPYLIKMHHTRDTPAERAGASLLLSILFSGGSLLLLGLAAIGLVEWGANPELIVIVCTMAGVAPFVLIRDFGRRFLFARFAFGAALLFDLAGAIAQLSTLGWLGESKCMSAPSAAIALGASAAFAGFASLYYTRGELSIRTRQVRKAAGESFTLGKWLFAARMVAQAQGSAMYWFTMAVAGPAATGVYAACMSIVNFANPIVLGLSNTFMPNSVLAWDNGGGPALWSEAIRSALLLAVVMGVFSITVLLVGAPVMQIVYRGSEFAGHRALLMALTLGSLVVGVGMPASVALATMERPRAIVAIDMAAGFLSIGLFWVLMERAGLLGAACGLLVAAAVSTIGRWVALRSLLRDGATTIVTPHARLARLP